MVDDDNTVQNEDEKRDEEMDEEYGNDSGSDFGGSGEWDVTQQDNGSVILTHI